jgi:hypothetical protein
MYKIIMTTAATALCLIVFGCSGGFESDGAGADKLGPLIFADTASE